MLVSWSPAPRVIDIPVQRGSLSSGLELLLLMPSGLSNRPLRRVYNPASFGVVLQWSKEFYSRVRVAGAPGKLLLQSFPVRWEVGGAVFPAGS